MSQKVCPLCQQELRSCLDRVIDAQTGHEFGINQCSKCGLGVTDPVPDNLDIYYGNDYHGGRHGFTTVVCDRRRARIIENLCSGLTEKRCLDVGCGDGTLLRRLDAAGWRVAGVEKYPESARTDGIRIFESLDQATIAAPFDCISLWHVLEHLPNLHETLASIRGLLAPGGVVVIAVPDFGGYQARLFGASWLHLDVPRHLYHFTSSSITRLFTQHNFMTRRLRLSEFEYDLMGFAQSTLNRSGAVPNAFMKSLTGRSTTATGLSRAIQILAGTMLCGVGCLPVLLSGRIGSGGTLVIAATLATEEK